MPEQAIQEKVLYDNSGKTADEVSKVVELGRRIFFAYLAQQRDQTSAVLTANETFSRGWAKLAIFSRKRLLSLLHDEISLQEIERSPARTETVEEFWGIVRASCDAMHFSSVQMYRKECSFEESFETESTELAWTLTLPFASDGYLILTRKGAPPPSCPSLNTCRTPPPPRSQPSLSPARPSPTLLRFRTTPSWRVE